MSVYRFTSIGKPRFPREAGVPIARYDGPFGPAELTYGRHHTRISGSEIPELVFDRGLEGRADGEQGLRIPIRCQIGEAEGRLHHPNWSLLNKRKRAVHLDLPDRHYLYYFAGIRARKAVERDGRIVGRNAKARAQGDLADWADPTDVPVLILFLSGSDFYEAIGSGLFT
ncbi:MAG: hypothetical protein ACRD0K_06900 [Egibacteraceae bacterium]